MCWWKSFENRSIFDENMGKSRVPCFSLTHGLVFNKAQFACPGVLISSAAKRIRTADSAERWLNEGPENRFLFFCQLVSVKIKTGVVRVQVDIYCSWIVFRYTITSVSCIRIFRTKKIDYVNRWCYQLQNDPFPNSAAPTHSDVIIIHLYFTIKW